MEKTISAAEANRQFSALLRDLREGHSYTITSRGKPVAKMVSVNGGDALVERRRREMAKRELLERLRSQRPMNLGRWSREELYDE